MRTALTIAATALALSLATAPGRAQSYGDAPWCAIMEMGSGEVVADCEYWSAAACAPHVIAGNRGFCNVNPRWSGPIPPEPGAPAPPRKHRVK